MSLFDGANDHRRFALPGASPQYGPDKVVAVEHIDLDLTPDIGAETLDGTCTTTVRALDEPVKRLSLDAVDLEIASVKRDGRPLEFASRDGKLDVTFAPPLEPGIAPRSSSRTGARSRATDCSSSTLRPIGRKKPRTSGRRVKTRTPASGFRAWIIRTRSRRPPRRSAFRAARSHSPTARSSNGETKATPPSFATGRTFRTAPISSRWSRDRSPKSRKAKREPRKFRYSTTCCRDARTTASAPSATRRG